MVNLVVATRNKNKKREIVDLLKGIKIKVLSLDDLKVKTPIVVENGRTFESNAAKKARQVSECIQGLTIADDSGLLVKALGDKPGVKSARFAGGNATDQENNAKLIKLLSKIPSSKRSAKFVSCIAIADQGRLITVVRGECPGRIILEPRGANGFGYDPLFVPNGYRLTFAEMGPKLKNKISHRYKALKKAKTVISKIL